MLQVMGVAERFFVEQSHYFHCDLGDKERNDVTICCNYCEVCIAWRRFFKLLIEVFEEQASE